MSAQQYRERSNDLRAEYNKRLEEWREQVDPAVLKEMNRRRVAKGRPRIRAPRSGRPLIWVHSVCVRVIRPAPTVLSKISSYFMDVQREYPRTEATCQAHFKAVSTWAASRWNAMSDTEKAVRASFLNGHRRGAEYLDQ
jgi:hypothetical protein